MTRDKFYEIRNSIYNELLENKIIQETDYNFMKIDEILGNLLDVNWES